MGEARLYLSRNSRKFGWRLTRSDRTRASLVAQLVENPLAIQEALFRFLSQEVPLEKGYATYSSILGLPWWLRQ